MKVLLALAAALQVFPVQHNTTTLLAKAAPQPQELIQFRGKGVTWSKYSLPLWITIHPDLEPWRPLIEAEARAWNARIGKEIFRMARKPLSEREQGSLVPFRPIWDQNPHTRLYFGSRSNILASPVYLPHIGQLDPAIRQRVIAHELGHVLGLAHDENDPMSLMYPKALPFDWAVQSNDVRILRDQYGRSRRQNSRRDPDPDDLGGLGSRTSSVAPDNLLDGSSCSDVEMLWIGAT